MSSLYVSIEYDFISLRYFFYSVDDGGTRYHSILNVIISHTKEELSIM